jgi:hypothetical protein
MQAQMTQGHQPHAQQLQAQLPSPHGQQSPHGQLSIDRISPQPQMMTRMLSPQPHSSFFQFTEVHDHDDYQYQDDSIMPGDLVRKVSEIRTSNDKAVQVPQDLLNHGYNLRMTGTFHSRLTFDSLNTFLAY